MDRIVPDCRRHVGQIRHQHQYPHQLPNFRITTTDASTIPAEPDLDQHDQDPAAQRLAYRLLQDRPRARGVARQDHRDPLQSHPMRSRTAALTAASDLIRWDLPRPDAGTRPRKKADEEPTKPAESTDTDGSASSNHNPTPILLISGEGNDDDASDDEPSDDEPSDNDNAEGGESNA